MKHVNDTNDAVWKNIYAQSPFIRKLLISGQVRRLPFGLRDMVMSDDFKGRFFYGGGLPVLRLP